MTGLLTVGNRTLIVLRYFIAAVLFLTAMGKLLDIPGFVEVLDTYQVIPGWGLYTVAIGIALLELRICEWLLRNKTLILGAVSSLIFHSIYTLWTSIALMRDLFIPNCGCFGVYFVRPLTGWTIVEDLVMVAASWALLFLANRKKKGYVKRNLQTCNSREHTKNKYGTFCK